MRLFCYAHSMGDPDGAIGEVKSSVKSLEVYGILPTGEVGISYHVEFDSDKVLASQRTQGPWLAYLHARRAGALPKLLKVRADVIQ